MYAPDSDSTIFTLTWRGATVRLFPPHDSYVYLIHFKTPYKHAKHYLGATSNLEARLQCHQQGHGARLMEVITQAGIEWEVSRLWRFDTYEEARAAEAHFKKRHGSVRLCPICQHKPLDILVSLRHGHWPLATYTRMGKRMATGEPVLPFMRRVL